MACNGRFLVSCTLLPQRVRSVCSWDPRHSPMTGTTILLDLGAAPEPTGRIPRERMADLGQAPISGGGEGILQVQSVDLAAGRAGGGGDITAFKIHQSGVCWRRF